MGILGISSKHRRRGTVKAGSFIAHGDSWHFIEEESHARGVRIPGPISTERRQGRLSSRRFSNGTFCRGFGAFGAYLYFSFWLTANLVIFSPILVRVRLDGSFRKNFDFSAQSILRGYIQGILGWPGYQCSRQGIPCSCFHECRLFLVMFFMGV